MSENPKAMMIIVTADKVHPRCEASLHDQDYDNYEVLINVKSVVEYPGKPYFVAKNLNIAANREEARQKALKTDAEYFLWGDSDIVYPRNTLSELILQMKAKKSTIPVIWRDDLIPTGQPIAQKHLMVGWYKNRWSPADKDIWLVGKYVADGTIQWFEQLVPGVMKADYFGLGCVCMTRELLEKIVMLPGVEHTIDNQFGRFLLDEGGVLSMQVDALGYECWADGNIVCEHIRNEEERADILWATLPREFWAKSRRNRFYRFSKFVNCITASCRQVRFKAQTFLFNVFSRSIPRHGRYLFAAPIGKTEKLLFEKLLKKFGHQDFDYVIFVYDDTTFNEPIYEQCKIIREAGAKWHFAKKYLTPEFCSKYIYIFVWDGDIDVETFSYKNFMDIVKRNNLEMAQPALAATRDSRNYHNHLVTLKDASYPIGRYTDFVEVMIPVFRQDAWVKFWNMIEDDYNCWGWGYDFLAKSVCGYKNMGIVDCEAVTHTRPPSASKADTAKRRADMERFFQFNRSHAMTRFSAYGGLK
jgi:hypothetical protein